MKKHGPSYTERKRNSPTVRNWRANMVAIVLLGVLVMFALFYLLRASL
jgi:hypothetical protein